MEDYNELFATFDQLGHNYDQLTEQALSMSNGILDKWEEAVEAGWPCPFCKVHPNEPTNNGPHEDDCPVLRAIAVQELDPNGRVYL